MGMAKTLAELRKLTHEELIRQHDEEAGSSVVGINYYLQELARRDADKQTREIVRLTRVMTGTTVLIGIFTLILLVRR